QQQIVVQEQEVEKLRQAEQETQNRQALLVETQKRNVQQQEVLQQDIAAREKCIQMLKEEMHIKNEQLAILRSDCSWNAEENLQSKENLFAEKSLQASREMEVLQIQMATSRQEAEREIETLNQQMQAISNSLDLTQKKLQTREDMVAKLKQDNIFQKELLQQQLLSIEEEVERFKKDNQSKEKQIMQLSTASSTQMDLLHQTKEQEILQIRKDNTEQMYRLQQQLALANAEKQGAHELQLATHKEKEELMFKIDQAEKDRRSLEKQLEALFIQAKESAEKISESEEMERQIEAAITENKILQLDLDKAQTNEKKLNSTVASLEAQLAFADQKLRAQNETVGNGKRSHKVQKKRAISSDSLEQSSLEDPLNNTRHLCTPDKSSTPRGCSPKPLARRPSFCAESPSSSLTPTSKRNGKENKVEFDSGWKTPASSVKRRRTTQVISITMAKKTSGNCEDEDTFGSLASAASHPNLSDGAFVRPVPMEPFDTPAKKMPPAGDQLIGLPGYRRSAVYPNSTSTFCVGAENEPDGASEDWMRIAELQARNKTCLPHLKSSYPVEFDTGGGSAFIFTDEELHTGDPSDTIRRASMMPGLLPAKNISLTQRRSSKDTKKSTSMASVLQTSPEKKMKASCFPHPLTPKNKNMLNGTSGSVLHPTLSPAERRQSMMFTIDNTPKNQSYLKKGLNKLRRSTRKSPCKNFKSPAQMSKNRGQENMPTMNIRTAVARAGRSGNSPRLATKSQK
uniref:Nuclear mitotic apparatus protein 1 n=1 Tax=Tetraodon nigroviridis TaxID=99883 RepID=H3BYB8_TETNG